MPWSICNPMFIAALFPTAKSQNQPKCPPIDERIKKMWYIHTMDYYSAIKRMKSWDAWVAQSVKWLPLAQVMLSGFWDQVLHWAPPSVGSLLLLSLCLPSVCHSAHLFYQINKIFKGKENDQRHTDPERMVMKEEVCSPHRCQQQGQSPPCWTTRERTRIRRQMERGEWQQETLLRFPWERLDEAG